MADKLTRSQRFASMSSNVSKGTQPEIVVRRLVHSMGYRYRLHRRNLPGCPDMVFPCRKKVILVNGCYWHRHNCRKGRSVPETRREFWENKFARTVQRDNENRRRLKKLGWKILIIWECKIKNRDQLKKQIVKFLED